MTKASVLEKRLQQSQCVTVSFIIVAIAATAVHLRFVVKNERGNSSSGRREGRGENQKEGRKEERKEERTGEK